MNIQIVFLYKCIVFYYNMEFKNNQHIINKLNIILSNYTFELRITKKNYFLNCFWITSHIDDFIQYTE